MLIPRIYYVLGHPRLLLVLLYDSRNVGWIRIIVYVVEVTLTEHSFCSNNQSHKSPIEQLLPSSSLVLIGNYNCFLARTIVSAKLLPKP